MQIDIFQDFTKKNILLWTQEIWVFIVAPRKFIKAMAGKAPEKLFSQYLFYFLIYTASYLFTLNSTEFNSAIKPSVVNIGFCIPIVLFFCLMAKLASGNSRRKEIFLFVITLNMVVGPIEIILYSVYLSNESQIYLIIFSILNLAMVTYMIYGIGFIIQEKFWPAARIFILSFFALSAIFLAVEYIEFQNNLRSLDTYENDVIFDEYRELFSSLTYSSAMPIKMNLYHNKKKVKTYYGIQDIGNSSDFIMDPDSIKRFKKFTNANIAILKSRIPKLKFQRNIAFAQTLLDYHTKLDLQLDSNFLMSNLNKLDDLMINNKIPGEIFMRDMDLGNLLGTTAYIQLYNNQIIKLHRLNENITLLQRASIFLGGLWVDNFIFSEQRIYPKESFYKLNDN